MINVKLGIIMVESRMVNQKFFSRHRNLANPYATRLQLTSVPTMFSSEITTLLRMYVRMGLIENTS